MLEDKYERLLEDIEHTALECGRHPKDISLIAVTKGVSWDNVQPIYNCGQRDFGESRFQEAINKITIAQPKCRWHFIGTLQKNKVRKVIENFTLIHSVDSFELAQKISEGSRELGIVTHILLQSNTSGEISKHGCTPSEWKDCFNALLALPSISIDGLMTMAPLTNNEDRIKDCFKSLRLLREELNMAANGRADLHHLSMGMSHDFKIAIAEGATLLRIGSAIFERP